MNGDLLRQEPDPGGDRVLRRADRDRFAVDEDALDLRVAAVRMTRASLLDDASGADEAHALLATLDVADPSLFTRSVLPGFPVVPSRADADAFHAP